MNREEAIETIAKWLLEEIIYSSGWENVTDNTRDSYRFKAKRLLQDIHELALVDREVNLPGLPRGRRTNMASAYRRGQTTMLEAGYVKELK